MSTVVRKRNAYFCRAAFLPFSGCSFSTWMLWNSALQQPDESTVNELSLVMLGTIVYGLRSFWLCFRSCSDTRHMVTWGREKPRLIARPPMPRILRSQTTHGELKIRTGFPLLLTENSRTLQDPQNVFPGLCRSPAMVNYRQTTVTYSVYTVWQYNPLQNVHRSFIETVQLAHSRNTSYIYWHMVFYTWKSCWLSWTTGEFQDFWVLGNFRKESRTFQQAWKPCTDI